MAGYYTDQNRGSDDGVFTGSTSDAYDIRYQDDSNSTYGKQYSSDSSDDDD